MHMVALSAWNIFSPVPQSNVTFLEGNRLLNPGAMWSGVFPHSEEVEERNYYQVRDRFKMQGHPVTLG